MKAHRWLATCPHRASLWQDSLGGFLCSSRWKPTGGYASCKTKQKIFKSSQETWGQVVSLRFLPRWCAGQFSGWWVVPITGWWAAAWLPACSTWSRITKSPNHRIGRDLQGHLVQPLTYHLALAEVAFPARVRAGLGQALGP